jgi:hypothetical protein
MKPGIGPDWYLALAVSLLAVPPVAVLTLSDRTTNISISESTDQSVRGENQFPKEAHHYTDLQGAF